MTTVYLNGEFIPLEDAKISVLDRGFTFGDGVYEVFLVYQKKIFRLAEHLQRLNNSLAAIYMQNPHSDSDWEKILTALVDKNTAADQSLYLQVTRGVSDRDHSIQIATKPTVFAMSKALTQRNLAKGVTAITCEDIRWKLCYIKAITLLPSVLLRYRASEAGAAEAILIKDNFVTEGAASNVFVVKNGLVKTPPKDGNLLPGITRDLIVELLAKEGIPCKEESITRDELFNADEIWITSTTWEIVPVVRLDEQIIGDGQPGKTWKKTVEIYQQFKSQI